MGLIINTYWGEGETMIVDVLLPYYTRDIIPMYYTTLPNHTLYNCIIENPPRNAKGCSCYCSCSCMFPLIVVGPLAT